MDVDVLHPAVDVKNLPLYGLSPYEAESQGSSLVSTRVWLGFVGLELGSLSGSNAVAAMNTELKHLRHISEQVQPPVAALSLHWPSLEECLALCPLVVRFPPLVFVAACASPVA
jgi:hypothetical protein